MSTSRLPSVALALVLGIAASCAAPASEGSGTAAPPGPETDETGAAREAPSDAERPDAPAPRTVQPGAPGEPSRVVKSDEASAPGPPSYVEADVRFMQGMIPHHAQALEMTALVPARTESTALRRLALRMEISQRDEIGLMERWLRSRGEPVPGEAAHGVHGAGELMPGMLTEEQMARLAAARGEEFVRLFLELMIFHHRGALVMVDQLLAAPGGGQASEVFQFASHVEADQRMEIRRMEGMLEAMTAAGGPPGPRP